MFKTFQSPNSPIMEGIIDLHNYIFFYLLMVLVFVSYFFYNIIKFFFLVSREPNSVEHLFFRFFCHKIKNVVHLPELETIWTIVPSFILMLIAVPSFTLLYAMDEIVDPSITLKAIGHQWYWSYEYSDNPSSEVCFNSYMKSDSDLKIGDHRLLEVDNSVILPIQTHVRILVSSEDVLHSWAVPSLGLKVDAVPGRLNQLSLYINKQGVFYGQCSELCGVNHGFMPIVIRAVSPQTYLNWWLEVGNPIPIPELKKSIPEPVVVKTEPTSTPVVNPNAESIKWRKEWVKILLGGNPNEPDPELDPLIDEMFKYEENPKLREDQQALYERTLRWQRENEYRLYLDAERRRNKIIIMNRVFKP